MTKCLLFDCAMILVLLIIYPIHNKVLIHSMMVRSTLFA